MTHSSVTVKRLPDLSDPIARRTFLREVKEFLESSLQPRLVVDLSAIGQIKPEYIDLLLECVDQAERSEGKVVLTGVSEENAVILELTQAMSVLNVFPSILEAANGRPLQAA